MKKRTLVLSLGIIGFLIGATVGMARVLHIGPFQKKEEELNVIHAGSLSVPFQELKGEYEEKYGTRIHLEGHGSRFATMLVNNKSTSYDVLGVADYHLIPDLLYKDRAKWVGVVATNQMCIAYTEESEDHNKINSTNWYNILNQDGITYGHSDKDSDPCGYRTIILWRLASRYYSNKTGKDINVYDMLSGDAVTRLKETDLISLLETGDLDYAFEYLSIAKQHDLKYVSLPDPINLGNFTYADTYEKGWVVIGSGEHRQNKTGSPILYGVTIPTTYQNYDAAIHWIEMLVGETGKKIFRENGQPPLGSGGKALTPNETRIPSELQDDFKEGPNLP